MLGRAILRLFAALGLLFSLVTFCPPLLRAWTHLLAVPYRDPKGDILIVLGADRLDTGAIGVTSYWRCTYAVLAWRSGSFHQVLVCGGPPKSPVSAPMRDFLVSQGIPAASIRLDTASTSTRTNALEAARLLAHTPGVKVLLTSDYHSLRAARAFRKAGLDVLPCYFPDALKRVNFWPDRWRVFCDLSLETTKLAWYKLHGWI
jgi:uncharacterized SAM-binding protein YcdF (DUF218 family)